MMHSKQCKAMSVLPCLRNNGSIVKRYFECLVTYQRIEMHFQRFFDDTNGLLTGLRSVVDDVGTPPRHMLGSRP